MQVTRVAADRPVPSLMHRRRVMSDRISYIGLDVHKESIVVAVASGGLRSEVREYGRIANTAAALDRLLRKLGSDGTTLRFCYEAGPCGYGIQRRLSAQGHECVVVAPNIRAAQQLAHGGWWGSRSVRAGPSPPQSQQRTRSSPQRMGAYHSNPFGD